MQIFDHKDYLTYGLNDAHVNPCTLGLLVDSDKQIASRWGMRSSRKESFSLLSLIRSVFKGLYNRTDIVKEKYDVNSIQISNNVSPYAGEYKKPPRSDLSLNEQAREKLIQNGRDAVRSYYEDYMGEDVICSDLDEAGDRRKKYFPKTPGELKRILETQVYPLLEEIHQEMDESYSHKKNKKWQQLFREKKKILQEEEIILRAMYLKGVGKEERNGTIKPKLKC